MLLRRSYKYGFTLIEIIFVIVLAGIIASIAIPRLSTTSTTAKESTNAQNISIINNQIERWYIEKGSFPATDLSDIGSDLEYFPDGLPVNPIDGTSYTLDPDTNRVDTSTEEETQI